ncbi:MAG: LuxR C-terminal-related transcriptional regulator [Coriobacteriia bacterium]|nr:LuxR C-terminal-related transcriptional regulator [Coriobacteriia bacterium]
MPAVSSATAVAADAAVLAAASAHESEPAPAPEPPSPLERLREAYGLTDREVQMAGYLAQGRTRAFIAGELYLSENTVKRHITTLYQKVGVHSKQDLIDLLQQQ